jgi:hypothetical protein
MRKPCVITYAMIIVLFAGHAIAQQPATTDPALRYFAAMGVYERCAMDYGRRNAIVNASAGDIADAASIACEEQAHQAELIKPKNLTDEFSYDRVRRKTIHVVVEERAKVRK